MNQKSKSRIPIFLLTAALCLSMIAVPVKAEEDVLSLSRTLSKGMHGDDVLEIQQRLYELGYLEAEPDGIYGNYTEAAVNAFQKANGLSYQDGKVGNWTVGKLNDIAASQNRVASNVPSPADPPADSYSVPVSISRNLSRGMRGDDVLEIQQRLYELGYLEAEPDGIFGRYTEAAVNAFQLANGLGYSDGIVGNWTIGKLNAASAVAPNTEEQSASAPANSGTSAEQILLSRNLSRGMTGDDVLVIQQKLYELGFLTAQPDGIFGRYTEAAVNAFQLANGLGYSDGIVGKWTTAKLNELLGTNNQQTSARILGLWMEGDDVLAAQQKLYDLGYLDVEPDGQFGIKTLAAVNMFQMAHGMETPDGKIGPWMYAKLENNPVPLDQASVFAQSDSFDNEIEFTRILKKGMSGKDVYAVQRKLYDLGYLSAAPDGQFGNYTLAAVKAFQKANGLANPDGMVGKWTIGKMNGSASSVLLSGNQITWIGDSLTASAGEAIFQQWFPGADYGNDFDNMDSYVASGKEVKNTYPWNPAGLTLLQNITASGSLRPYLVFELGSNEPWVDKDGKDRGYMEELRTLAGDKTQIVLVTTATNYEDNTANNAFLSNAEKRYSNIYVADWAAAAKNEYLLDGLHFNYSGTKTFFNTIRDSLLESAVVEAVGR